MSCGRPAAIVHVITNLHASSGGPTTAVVEIAREQAGPGDPDRMIVDEALADAVSIARPLLRSR